MRSPFVVAELSASHCGSLDRAFDLVEAAKAAGADACKLQTWSRMTVSDEVITDGPWAAHRLADLYEEARTPWAWHAPIFDRCRELGMVAFSTPFDAASVEFLEELGAPMYKIASFEITDIELIQRVAATHKPVILSTGMATEQEIVEAVVAAKAGGAATVTLLKCVSAYPASAEGFNLRTMVDMRSNFACDVGLSDHTLGSVVAVAATALGARVIEKHITIDGGGPDGGFATTPAAFTTMVRDVRAAAAALGSVRYGPVSAELPQLHLRRSLWVTKDVAAGEALSEDNVACLRPQGGLPPGQLRDVIGRCAAKEIAAGTPLREDLVA